MSSGHVPPSSAGRGNAVADLIADNREARELERKEQDRLRALQYEEARSELNSTAVRVRAWEKLHGLRLPLGPDHPILRVISAATALSIAELRDEQRARREALTPRPAADVEVTNAPPNVAPDSSAK